MDRAFKLRLIRFTPKERNSSQGNCVTKRKVRSKEICKPQNWQSAAKYVLKSCSMTAKIIHETNSEQEIKSLTIVI